MKPDFNLINEEKPNTVVGALTKNRLIKTAISWLEKQAEDCKSILRGYADTIDVNGGRESIEVDLGGGLKYSKTRVVKKREIDFEFLKNLSEEKNLPKVIKRDYQIDSDKVPQLITLLKDKFGGDFLIETESVDEFEVEKYVIEGKLTQEDVSNMMVEKVEWQIRDVK